MDNSYSMMIFTGFGAVGGVSLIGLYVRRLASLIDKKVDKELFDRITIAYEKDKTLLEKNNREDHKELYSKIDELNKGLAKVKKNPGQPG